MPKEEETITISKETYDALNSTIHSLEEACKDQQQYLEELQKNNTELRSFKHDINNHFLTIHTLLQNEKVPEALEYLDSISKHVSSLRSPFSTNNLFFDALLEEKEKEMEDAHIPFQKEVDIHANLNIQPLDIITLFSNAFDNAIEASKLVKDNPYITLKMKSVGTSLVVKLINSYSSSPSSREDGLLYTSKADSINHGIGLTNIKKTIEKYNGSMQIDFKEYVFTLSFTLFNV